MERSSSIPEVTAGASADDTFAAVLERHLSRRSLLKAGVAASAVVLGAALLPEAQPAGAQSRPVARLTFEPISPATADAIAVAKGHRHAVLIRWGDPIFADAPAWDPAKQSADTQAKQFGYNCDFLGYLPLPMGTEGTSHGLLWVNHEYTNPELMFAGYDDKNPTSQQVDVEIAAHGASIVEVQRGADGQWTYQRASRYNRRLTGTTPMVLTGPAAGSDWTRTSADPSGTQVVGTLNNCGGGVTPWGTILTAEENFHQYFANLDKLPAGDWRKQPHQRYGLPGGESERKWERVHRRFDVSQEPSEPFRFGWVVEVDPYDPSFTPRKRTALGRFRHEAATVVVARDQRVVVYSGDDERFDYAYKFVSAKTYNSGDRQANLDLLDEGTLYVAKFHDDGTGEWLPLVQGQGPLTPAAGFRTQADVLVNARFAGDVLGATKMDRPEDVEVNPANGKLYLAMTNNTQRGTENRPATDAANPRAQNRHGHVIELTENGDDHAATNFRWNIFLLCGDPQDPSTYFGGYPKDKVSAISSPDNITFDRDGNLWIATDGMPSALQINDGLFAVPVAGPERGCLRQIFSAVRGAELASLHFNADNTAIFLAIQHPGEGGTVEKPASSWPDGTNVPRPSVVVVSADGGERVGLPQVQSATNLPTALPRTGTFALPAPAAAVAGAGLAAAGLLLRLRNRLEGLRGEGADEAGRGADERRPASDAAIGPGTQHRA